MADNEFSLIARHFAPLAAGVAAARGLLDDAAVLTPEPGFDIVITTDALIAGVHFERGWAPETVAAKALGVNLSDLAAMGADAVGYTLALALPAALDDVDGWAAAFARGLGSYGGAFGIALLGGDTVATPGPLTVCITALGRVPSGAALGRAGAEPGHKLFVSGTIGDAALGLRLAQGSLQMATPDDADYLLDRLARPQPRLALGQALRGLASAAIDISDGLCADLGHLARASGLAAAIDWPRVPLSPAARAVGEDAIQSVLGGGDDYELLFAAPAGNAGNVIAAGRECGVAVTEIGALQAGPPGRVVVIGENGTPLPVDRPGYSHF